MTDKELQLLLDREMRISQLIALHAAKSLTNRGYRANNILNWLIESLSHNKEEGQV